MSYAVRILSAEFSFRFTPAFVERNVGLRQLPVRESFEMRRNSHVQRFATAVFVAGALLVIAFGLRTTVAQDPEDPIPETEYIIQPGEEGYVIVPTPPPDGGVQGDAQHECEDDPLAPECDPAPPTGLRLTRAGTTLSVHYTYSGWRGSNTHRYRIELHRSSTRGGTYTLNKFAWTNVRPQTFRGLSRGYYYKARAKRCRTWNINDCGDWTAFVGPTDVPRLPAKATNLDWTREKVRLTAAYTGRLGSYDEVEIAHRTIGTTGSGEKTQYKLGLQSSSARSYGSDAVRGNEYRFRVRRCTDSGHTDCGGTAGWSDWSPWIVVPKLATGLSISRVKVNLTASYSREGTSYDKIDMNRRLIGASGDGGTEADGNITGTSYVRNGVVRGYEYRFRVRRCVDRARTDCGGTEDWSSWSPWKVVPKLATGLSISRVKVNLTASYSREGTTHDVIDMDRRLIGTTGSGSTEAGGNITGTSYRRNGVVRGYEYRFRVRRCVDRARTDCGGTEDWSSWSAWKVVPKLATGLSISRVKVNLTASYSREGTTYDVIDMNRRLIGGSGVGGGTEADGDITGTSYRRNGVERGYEYRFRVRRCVDRARTDCGGREDWSGWSPWKVVPKLATGLSPSRNRNVLTATYSREGTSYDVIDMNRRLIGATGNGGSAVDGNVSGTRYTHRSADWGYEYRFRIRRCVDRARTDCGGASDWSGWSRWIRILRPAAGLSLSRSKVELTATYSRAGTSHDEIDMNRRLIDASGDGETEVDVDITDTSYVRNSVDRGYEYRFRVRRCEDVARTQCGGDSDWSGWSAWKVVPKLATSLGISRDEDDLTASYSREGTTHDVIDMNRRPIGASGVGGTEADGNVTGTRYIRNNVDRGYEYRFRVRRCVDSNRNDCGGDEDWSDWSAWKVVPKLATNLTLSRLKRTLTATYSREGRSYDLIDMDARTIGTTGDGSAEADDDVTGTRFIRRNVDRGDEYRFRVRRCVDSARSEDCGGDDDWSGWSDWVPVPNLPSLAGKPTITVSDDDLTVTYTARGTAHDELLFQQSDSETSGFSNYTGGTLSGKKLSDVDRGKWYRVGVRRCTDSEFTDCTDLSEYSDPKEVVAIGAKLATRADGKSAVASLTLLTGFNYMLQLQSSTSGRNWTSVGASENIASSATSSTYTALTGGSLIYRVQINACTVSRPRVCTNHESNEITLSKAPAPNISRIALANEDDLTVVYTLTSWTDGSGDVYDFEIKRAETATGSFADYEDADTPPGMPHKFNDVHTGYYYKARARRCSDSALTICGDWSGLSSSVHVPALAVPAPTIRVSLTTTLATVQATFTPGASVRYHVFEVGKSDTQTGTFVYGSTTQTSGTSAVTFSALEIGKWYKVRGKGCEDTDWKRCGAWSYSLDAVEAEGIGVELASRADGKSAIARLTLYSGFNYTLQLQSRAAGGSWPSAGSGASIDSSVSSRTYTSLTGGSLVYRARLNACPTGTPSNCTDYNSQEVTLSKAPAPSISSITLANQDDLTVVYTVTAWTDGSGDHYDFEIQRAETATGSFADYGDATTQSATPHKFNDVHTGYHYKARGRRCSDDAATICGNWSGYSSAVNVPALDVQAPTNINVSNPSLAAVRATFTPGSSVRYHIFEVGKSDTETGSFVYAGATNVGATSPVTFSSLEAGKWYKARGRGCEDTDRKRCGSWAYSPGAVRVGGIAVTIGSGADGKSVIASLTLFSGFTYSLQLYGSTNQKDWSDERRIAKTPDAHEPRQTYTGLVKEHYRAELTACKSEACVTYRSNTIAISKAPAPAISSVTLANEDDLTVDYTLPTWNYGSGDVLDFEIKREESSSGMFDTDYTQAMTPSDMPHKFNDVHTGYYYKARGRRCSNRALTICGDWSGLSSAVNVPALSAVLPPTDIRLSIVSHTQVQAKFTPSSLSGHSVHNYVLEVGESDTRTGTYLYGRRKHITSSPVTFSSLPTGKWYKVRGKRCFDANRKRCGTWAEPSNAVQTVEPNPKVKVDNAASLMSMGAGQPRSVDASAAGLDVTKLYRIEFRTSSNGVLKFAKCDAKDVLDDLPDIEIQNLTPGSGSSGPVSKPFYGCDPGFDTSTGKSVKPPPTDTLVVNLVEGVGTPVQWRNTVDTVRITVVLKRVPESSGLRVDGDNRGSGGFGRFVVAWRGVADATSYELRHGKECPDTGNLCADSAREASWTAPYIRMASSPHVVVSNTPRALYRHLRRVEVRTVRNGVPSMWSEEEVFVHPTDVPPIGSIATMPFYGHHLDREYTFRICDDTFPAESRNSHTRWVSSILNGAQSWQKAMNWSSAVHGEDRNYLSVTRDTSKTDSSTGRDSCPTLSVLGLLADVARFAPSPGAQILGYATHLAMWVIGHGDWNYPNAELRFVPREALIARCLGYQPSVLGCAPVGVGLSSLSSFAIDKNNPLPDDIDVLLLDVLPPSYKGWLSERGPEDERCTRLEAVVAHEVGHTLGVWAWHADGEDLLMNTSLPLNACGPQSYDVAAMLANYQSLR